jgi:hypothetical protein
MRVAFPASVCSNHIRSDSDRSSGSNGKLESKLDAVSREVPNDPERFCVGSRVGCHDLPTPRSRVLLKKSSVYGTCGEERTLSILDEG